jgi:hypothetical protein
VVWEGWRRETSPYPDHWHLTDVSVSANVRFALPAQPDIAGLPLMLDYEFAA